MKVDGMGLDVEIEMKPRKVKREGVRLEMEKTVEDAVAVIYTSYPTFNHARRVAKRTLASISR